MPTPLRVLNSAFVRHSSCDAGAIASHISIPQILHADLTSAAASADTARTPASWTNESGAGCFVSCPDGATYLDIFTVGHLTDPLTTAPIIRAFGFIPFDGNPAPQGAFSLPTSENTGAASHLSKATLQSILTSATESGIWIPLRNENTDDWEITLNGEWHSTLGASTSGNGLRISAPYTLHIKGVTQIHIEVVTAASEWCAALGVFQR